MNDELRTGTARPLLFYLAVISITVLAACSTQGPPQLKYHPIEVKNGGSVSGNVRFSGSRPEAAPIIIEKDRDVCGALHTNPAAPGNGDGIRGAIVYLDTITAGKPFDLPLSSTLDQKGCEFIPHVQVVKAGAVITVSNSDKVLHNAHFWLDIKTNTNIAQSEGSPPQQVPLNLPGLYTVKCDIHPWMRAFVMAAEHPYFAVTDSNGHYSLTNIPPGKYTVKVWRDSWTIDQLKDATQREYDWRSDYRDQAPIEIEGSRMDTVNFFLH